jgi:hypothetical protein
MGGFLIVIHRHITSASLHWLGADRQDKNQNQQSHIIQNNRKLV